MKTRARRLVLALIAIVAAGMFGSFFASAGTSAMTATAQSEHRASSAPPATSPSGVQDNTITDFEVQQETMERWFHAQPEHSLWGERQAARKKAAQYWAEQIGFNVNALECRAVGCRLELTATKIAIGRGLNVPPGAIKHLGKGAVIFGLETNADGHRKLLAFFTHERGEGRPTTQP